MRRLSTRPLEVLAVADFFHHFLDPPVAVDLLEELLRGDDPHVLAGAGAPGPGPPAPAGPPPRSRPPRARRPRRAAPWSPAPGGSPPGSPPRSSRPSAARASGNRGRQRAVARRPAPPGSCSAERSPPGPEDR